MEINKLISSAIIFLVTIALVFIFVMPKYQSTKDLKGEFTQKQAEYNGKSAYYTKIDELIKTLESKKEALEKIDSALTPSFSLAPLVYFLQKKSGEAGLVVSNMSLSGVPKPAGASGIKEAAFSISLTGNYQGLKDFLSSLDKSARLFEVNLISFGGAGLSSQDITKEQAPSRTYSFNLELKTHTY